MQNIQYFLLAIVVIFLFACKAEEQKAEKKEIVTQVEAIIAKPDSVSIPIHCTGRLSSKTEIKLSFKTGGLIKKIYADEGDAVKEGEILAALNLSEIQARVNQAKLALQKSERDFERAKSLYNDSVATLEQYQNAETALDYARTNVEIAEFNLRYSQIVAPADGKILKKVAEVNEMIGPGYPVFLFASTEKYWIIRSSVTDKDIVKISNGDNAKISFDAYDTVFYGKVGEVAGMADPYTGTYEVEVNLQPTDKKLVTGFIGRVSIVPQNKKQYFLIPIESMVEGIGKIAYIYKVNNDNTISKIKVYYETILDKKILVKKGISTGDKIITKGANFLNDKSKIKITKTE